MLWQLGRHEAKLRTALARMKREDFVRRFLARDPTLWKQDDQNARVIRGRMGWMPAATAMRPHAGEMTRFAAGVVRDGFRQVVLVGMGGSSLCPDVLRRAFRRRSGYPALHVLDTTDPEAIAAVEKAIDPARTLVVVASKSGTTIESAMLARRFAALVPPAQMVAITDPATVLEREAQEEGFRAVFPNPPDVGGRYSALTYFGMLPAALLGIDVARLLARAEQVMDGITADLAPQECPPIALGAAIGALGGRRRDKVTFVISSPIASFGVWVEQLIAESTGKEGRGLVPVEGEPLAAASRYGKDRLLVRLRLRGVSEPAVDRRLRALRQAGHPCITMELEDLYDIGAQFMIWEIATAVAGSLLGVNPFDEPNVAESKANTRRMLEQYAATGSLPATPPDLDEDGVQAWALPPAWKNAAAGGLVRLLSEVRRSVRPGDYIALLAYLPAERAVESRLQALRLALRDACRAAATVGYGPRYLHSTGQLHKGGPPGGVFIQITSDKNVDVPIPREAFTFATLQAAQAAGDFESLAARGRRLLRLHLAPSKTQGLDRILSSL